VAAAHAMRPGINERNIAALMQFEFQNRGCERPAYAPIVGSGPNSTVLHYGANSRQIENGEVIVMDVAGEYSMYTADITRTLPANGHFSSRQREIYDIVLGAQRAAEQAFQNGKSVMTGMGPDSLFRVAYEYMNSHEQPRQRPARAAPSPVLCPRIRPRRRPGCPRSHALQPAAQTWDGDHSRTRHLHSRREARRAH